MGGGCGQGRQANPGARYDTKVLGLEGKGGVCGRSNGGVFFPFFLLVSVAITTSPAIRFVCYEIYVSRWSLVVLTLLDKYIESLKVSTVEL